MRTDISAKSATVNAEEFISTLQPSLSQGRLEEALAFVRERWTCPQVIALLQEKNPDVRKVAALALSLVGDRTAVKPLAVALHDKDPMVAQMAEHGLWAVWFRLGRPSAVCLVKCGNTHMHHGNNECAIEKFSQAIQEDPDFAEAYNQRAIAHYLSERFEESIEDCKAALARMPQHFGAMAGMGHCYRLALAIHPRLEGIEASLAQIEQVLREV